MRITIYQPVKPEYMFRVDENKHFYKIRDYEIVFDEIEDDGIYLNQADKDILEGLFERFNCGEYPESYRGHSLSVGDIVELNDNLYICDSIGWNKIEWVKD